MSTHEIEIEQRGTQWLAAVRRRVAPSELSVVVPEACGEVWRFIEQTGMANSGLNVAVYHNGLIDLECGVIVPQPFTPSETVLCLSTPAGRMAKAEHFGPYSLFGRAHRAVVDWCTKQGEKTTRLNWEPYDHWNDDVSKLHTTVYYPLEDRSESKGA